MVSKFVLKNVHDSSEGVPPVMALQILDVLKNEHGRFVTLDDVCDGKEEIALLLVLKTVFASQTVFLGHARYAERLAGETGAKNVELWDVGHGNGMYIAMGLLTEVGFIREL